MTVDQAADYLGVSVGTLYNWSSQRKNIPFVKFGRLLRFDVRQLDAFMERCEVYPQGGPAPQDFSSGPVKVIEGGIFG